MPAKMTDASLRLRALYRAKPVEARAEILQAFELSNGVATKAANLLGVPHRTLLRYLADDHGIKTGVEAVRKKHEKARD